MERCNSRTSRASSATRMLGAASIWAGAAWGAVGGLGGDGGRQGQGEAAAAGGDDQAGDDGGGDGDDEAELGAGAGDRRDLDPAPQALDAGPHDVEADAPARRLRQRGGGGDAALEDQTGGLVVAQRLC